MIGAEVVWRIRCEEADLSLKCGLDRAQRSVKYGRELTGTISGTRASPLSA